MGDISQTTGMRHRRKSSKKKFKNATYGTKDTTTNDTTTTTTAVSSNDHPSKTTRQTWGVIKDFPIIVITSLVMIPYALYNSYLFLHLQRPDIISKATMGLLRPRLPAISLSDPRQVLIVGTISSGTSQVTADWKRMLGLEIGHENSEATWSFVRDGTVSWFHGIRYIPRPGMDTSLAYKKNDKKESGKNTFSSVVNELCREFRPNMGFHPFMFRNGKCSLRQSWNACWKNECRDVLKREWGCGLRKIKSSSGDRDDDACDTPFQKVLLQVRHPLRTIESLVAKFCIGDDVEGDVQPAFVTFMNALFPHHNFSLMSCIEAAGYYVDEYNSALLTAQSQGYLGESFHVEDMTPCAVAELAGFVDENALYSSSRDLVINACSDMGNKAVELMKSTENSYNKGLLAFDWDDLLGGKHGSRTKEGDLGLQKRIKKLAHKLGYQ